jgi:hypothetical protein
VLVGEALNTFGCTGEAENIQFPQWQHSLDLAYEHHFESLTTLHTTFFVSFFLRFLVAHQLQSKHCLPFFLHTYSTGWHWIKAAHFPKTPTRLPHPPPKKQRREARTVHVIASIDLRNPVATRSQLSCFFSSCSEALSSSRLSLSRSV